MKSRIAALATVLTLTAASAALGQSPGTTPTPAQPNVPASETPAPQRQAGPGANRFAQRLAMMLQGITLTDTQRVQIDSIVARSNAAMPAFQPGQRPDSAAMATRREATAARDRQIRAVLTADQQRVFDANIEEIRANMPQGRP
jgi:Spy/CpxP family protein refolding chaperone